MIIQRQEDVTKAVLEAYKNIADPRLREIVAALVKHLHAFAREVHLTEEEFQQGTAILAKLGQMTTDKPQRSGADVGLARLLRAVCLLNNGNNGQTETTANLLGPFWRMNSPRHRKRRLDRAFADAGAGAVRQLLAQGPERQADRRRRGRHLAFLAGRFLRATGSQAGRHEPARQVHHRQGRPFRLPQRQARRLSDSRRRAGGRPGARRRPPQLPPGASALPDLQGRLQDA